MKGRFQVPQGKQIDDILSAPIDETRLPRRFAAPVVPPLGNPNGPGYGGEPQWPFSWRKALESPGYRDGVDRASNNPYYASNWRHHATNLLLAVNTIVYYEDADPQ